jgi:hypothetical protein
MAPEIEVTIRGGDDVGGVRRFDPEGVIQGSVRITPDSDLKCKHIFVRARWYTEGRGEKDEGVGAEQDVFQGELRTGVPSYYSFYLKLPREPWSFAGRYVNILWEVEVSIDLALARDPRASELIIMAYPRK